MSVPCHKKVDSSPPPRLASVLTARGTCRPLRLESDSEPTENKIGLISICSKGKDSLVPYTSNGTKMLIMSKRKCTIPDPSSQTFAFQSYSCQNLYQSEIEQNKIILILQTFSVEMRCTGPLSLQFF